MQRAAADAAHFGQHLALAGAVVGDADGPAEMADAELAQDFGQGVELLRGCHVAGQPAAIFRTVFQVLIGRQSEGPRLHGVVQDLPHLVQLGLGDRGALAGGDHAQHVAAQRRERHQGADVDAEALAVQAVHVFGEGLPIPAHSQAHGLQGYGLNAVHHPHIEIAVCGPGRGESETALPHGQGRNAEPAGQGCVGIPVQLRVVVGMQVHGAGGHDAVAGVQLFGAGGVDAPADHGDAAVLDAHVGADAGQPGAVDYGSTANYQIKLRHIITSCGGLLHSLMPCATARAS